jgi:Ca2+-binding RTX toxin-like protein
MTARRRTPPIALVLGLAGLLLAAAPAMAGTAAIVTKHYADPTGSGCSKYAQCEYFEIDYVGAPGEINAVTVNSVTTPGAPGQAVIHDGGAPISPGEGCTRIDDHTVVCSRYAVSVRAGDMDDSVTGADTVRGGPGDDRLTGDATDQVLDGEEGNDTLSGGDGEDILRGGEGVDVVLGEDGGDTLVDDEGSGVPGADRLDGGPDWDTVDYRSREDPVVVRLGGAGPTAERTGEGDSLRAIEAVYGGSGDDLLAGSRLANTLWGGPGDDRISGRGGSDELDGDDGRDQIRGGAGADRLSGNAGADTILARDGRRDRVSGGRGRDRARVDRGLDRMLSVDALF